MHHDDQYSLKRRLRWPIGFGLLWFLFLFALAAWSAESEHHHFLSTAERRAKTLFEQMVLVRSWNTGRDGIFVKSTPDSPPNPHLKPQDRTLTTDNGTLYSRLNPAYMTRQLGVLSEKQGNVVFHIAGLEPMSATNTPDPWEKECLISFEWGGVERFQLVDSPSGKLFRYMAPLKIEKKCLYCHPKSAGKKKTLGGISVSFPAEALIAARKDSVSRIHITFTLIGLVGLAGIMVSTYQILRKRDEAQRANDAKSMFIANMSHDMRTPLNGIMGMTELVEKRGLNTEQQRHILMVRQSARNLLEIVNDITEFSRLESGHLELSESPFDFQALLDETLEIYTFSAEAKGLTLHNTITSTVPRILIGDAFRIKQIIGNLVGNAIKFTKEGTISILVEQSAVPPLGKKDICLQISVKDTGVGIPEKEFHRIFDSFRQVDDSYAKRHVGTGLGLAICKRLIHMMDGDIRVHSRLGYGTTFSFTIRLRAGDADIPTITQKPSSDTMDTARPKKILLVEDNELNQCFFLSVLRDAGHTVIGVSESEAAHEQLKHNEFDLILMDIQMPGMDGLEISRRIRNGDFGSTPDIPIIAITASIGPDVEKSCHKAGMNGYLKKPISSADLLQAVNPLAATASETTMNTPSPQSTKILDPQAALANLNGKHTLYGTLLQTFLVDTPQKITALEQAVATANHAEVHRLSHAIKNSAALIQANQLAELALALEKFDHDTDDDIEPLLTALKTTYEHTVSAITLNQEAHHG
ncbi:ATP-binding protein [Pseudodesulfovibrio sp. JC047]|uniref:ATP-binding protein n=1 Tax=Pseudodesulfovibrio sp. JC047 TaxID=2683199 RepID=UPI0013D87D03|nr:ATP-binding protein [Pseudodesulfovibrio sp. JC047]